MIFLDFDGVIVDSIEECYVVSCETYYGYSASNVVNNSCYKDIFYKFRGLVRPAREYMNLHRAIEYSFSNTECKDDIESLFYQSIKATTITEGESFEEKFFFTRLLCQKKNFPLWIKMNPLTDFGKTLVGYENSDIIIITTKNLQSVSKILEFYKINVEGIYANDDVRKAGSKGEIIKSIMDAKNELKAVFVDDSVEHLNTVRDGRVVCYFANWGYGHDDGNYPIYEY